MKRLLPLASVMTTSVVLAACTVRGRQSRERRRLFSENLVSGGMPRPSGNDAASRPSLVNPWVSRSRTG